MTHQLISLASKKGFQCLAITMHVRSFLRQHGGREGAVVVSGQHTTTAVIINEMEERLLHDMEQWLTQIAPAAAPWLEAQRPASATQHPG